MIASITTAAATTIQIVPFGRRSISTTATVTPAASIGPVRDRFPLMGAVSLEHGCELAQHARGVGLIQRRQRDDQRLDAFCPRLPDQSVGAEENDRRGADRGGEMADPGVVSQVYGRVAQNAREEWERWLPVQDRPRGQRH